ncbi:MAG TPA: transcription elongation factor GreA [Jatrophihabitans sp.]
MDGHQTQLLGTHAFIVPDTCDSHIFAWSTAAVLGSRLRIGQLRRPDECNTSPATLIWSTDVSSTDDAVTFLTQEAYDRLSHELDDLIANRPTMSKEINDRREEGDLRENGGYHAAREEQGKQEGRILQLQELLRSAKVGEAPVSDGVAGPGMVVEVRFDGDDEVETFLIGSREEAETAAVEVYSAASPLGKALTGAREGDTVEYETPNGKTMKVTLVSAKPYTG